MRFQQGFFRLFENKTGYAYTNTRVRAAKARLLKKSDYDRMIKMSISEIARFLSEREYKKEFNELAKEYEGAMLIEYALNKNLEQCFRRIYGFSIKAAHQQIELYFELYDLHNILTLLKGKLTNESNESILNNLIIVGKLKKEFFERAVKECKDLVACIEYLKDTEYYETIKNNYLDFGRMEDLLYKQIYEKILADGESELKRIIIKKIEIKNKLNLLRAKSASYKEYDKITLNYGKPLKILLKEIENMENRLIYTSKIEKELIEEGIKMMHQFKKNIGPILGYFIAKENEVRNLRLITRLKQANISELIEQQLVI